MKRNVYKDKYYTHFDCKKHYKEYRDRVENNNWVSKHGFYPFIHFQIRTDKYKKSIDGKKKVVPKNRDIYYSAHVDRYIYEYYGNRLNNKYNKYLKKHGINKVSRAYRNCTPGMSNIDFAKEVFEFIVNCESAFIFIGDFSNFFDKLNHKYLKEKICDVIGGSLDCADYAIYKNITRFSYIEAKDIEDEKDKRRCDMRKLDKYFETKEFQNIKKKHLKKNNRDYGIPQGSSISAVYANVYMIDFDKKINDYITSNQGIYRRYCDDIIMVIPMSKNELDNKKDDVIVDYIGNVKEEIPNLILNTDKTERFFYNNGEIINLFGNSNLISYLGFLFDGKNVRIRDKSIFKFYCRAYKKIKKVKEENNIMHFNAGKKAIYETYTHLGAIKKYGKRKKGNVYGNFLTYAYKADKVFSKSDVLNSEIRSQVKRHWWKIDNKLKYK